MVTVRQSLCSLFLVTGATIVSGQHSQSVPPATAVSTHSSSSRAVAGLPASPRQPLSYYTQSMNSGMFGGRIAVPAPKTKAVSSPRNARSATRSPRLASATSSDLDPLADYAFTGLVTVRGRTSALIEHTKTRAGVYVGIGERFLSGKIIRIDARRLTLALNGANRSLARFENYRLTPLDADAPFLSSGAGAPSRTPVAPGPGQAVPPAPAPAAAALNGAAPAGENTAMPPVPVQPVPVQIEQKSLPGQQPVENVPPVNDPQPVENSQTTETQQTPPPAPSERIEE